MSGNDGSEVLATCNLVPVMDKSTDKKLDFSLQKFYLGDGF